jgi:hypothetical protein
MVCCWWGFEVLIDAMLVWYLIERATGAGGGHCIHKLAAESRGRPAVSMTSQLCFPQYRVAKPWCGALSSLGIKRHGGDLQYMIILFAWLIC